jgi:hypothetical protein
MLIVGLVHGCSNGGSVSAFLPRGLQFDLKKLDYGVKLCLGRPPLNTLPVLPFPLVMTAVASPLVMTAMVMSPAMTAVMVSPAITPIASPAIVIVVVIIIEVEGEEREAKGKWIPTISVTVVIIIAGTAMAMAASIPTVPTMDLLNQVFVQVRDCRISTRQSTGQRTGRTGSR